MAFGACIQVLVSDCCFSYDVATEGRFCIKSFFAFSPMEACAWASVVSIKANSSMMFFFVIFIINRYNKTKEELHSNIRFVFSEN